MHRILPLLLVSIARIAPAASSTAFLSVSPNPARFGEAVTLTATVGPAGATGWVMRFYRDVTAPNYRTLIPPVLQGIKAGDAEAWGEIVAAQPELTVM